ncbi:hypothetical protein P9D36_14635 [Bacillus haynesii]|uniref:hypothetical protein n=1 Tax=Bacillus haynesii TaxID=1925021 RepID=UPI002280F593|nr:hypothetical protein [Bacillus haynesii]MCY8542293.1 hypothetical protein [Bacillus haynesii]MEC1357323.1 hypothetical protein [Bacillus haynesii]MEC1448610.1 hypothetical protein [Bacillus haynesii]
MFFIFKYLDNNLTRDIYSLFKNKENSSSNIHNEFKDVEFATDYIKSKYVKSFDSYELIYDDASNKLVTKKFSRLYSADVLFSFKNNFFVIYGEKTVCLSVEKNINQKLSFTPNPWKFTLTDFTKILADTDYLINEFKFSNVKLLNTLLSTITLEFTNNFDALKIIKDFGTDPIYIKFKLFFNDEECNLEVFINSGHVYLSYEKFHKKLAEFFEEKILNLIEVHK